MVSGLLPITVGWLDVTTFYIYKKNWLIILAKFLKDILQLLAGLQFDIGYVIKTRVGFETAEIARILNYFSN